MRVLSWVATFLVTIPLTIFGLSLALSNGELVRVALWPLAEGRVPAMPLGVLGVVLLGVGFLCGAAFVSLQAQAWRFRSWQLSRQVTRLEKDLASARPPVSEAARTEIARTEISSGDLPAPPR